MSTLINKLPREFKAVLIDRLSSAELVDFLDVPVEDMIELLEDTIIENITEIQEYIQYNDEE